MLSQKFVRFSQRWPILGVWLLEPDSANNVAFTESYSSFRGGWMHDCSYNYPDLLAIDLPDFFGGNESIGLPIIGSSLPLFYRSARV
jgi:hypothetical protein